MINIRNARGGDIIFTKLIDPTFISKGIMYFQKKLGFEEIDYSITHTMGMGAYNQVVTAEYPKVVVKDISDFLNDHIIEVYRFTDWGVRNNTSDAYRFMFWFATDNNKGYDVLSFPGFIIRAFTRIKITLHALKKVFCSETIFNALQHTYRIDRGTYDIIGDYSQNITEYLDKFYEEDGDKITPAHMHYAIRNNPNFINVTDLYLKERISEA